MDPLSIATVVTLVGKNASSWLVPLRQALLDKGTELGLEKGIQSSHGWLSLDEKRQLHHLELALRNAAERGLARFRTLEERDQYRDVLYVLCDSGLHAQQLRSEAMRLFLLFESPDLEQLNETYNLSQRIHALAQNTVHENKNIKGYLKSFFEALVAELYIDPLFHEQIGGVLKVRTMLTIQRSLEEVVTTLYTLSDTFSSGYSVERFEQEVKQYIEYAERTSRSLKLVGVVPKDREHENVDPKLEHLFVPLRTDSRRNSTVEKYSEDDITECLEQDSYVVLLGGPGSGKSTVTRYLAWKHALANEATTESSDQSRSLLSGTPIPLRIELRRLIEGRRQRLDFDFLSYAIEVLLGRNGLTVSRQMFETLLERRLMLLLFDGLDEVATLDERRGLIEEIEDVAQRYPGNRILVTSRPVGYDLVRFSSLLFSHIHIQVFNDEQIHTFLTNWYTYVLRLSPLPLDDQLERDSLYKTLTENTRLHTLAENPLLLTVITALHRYERLPDRRIRIYDRCADLLLETWAKLRGTDIRWKDMRMSQEDQYACVAHLGYVLHERSQEGRKDVSHTNDVSARFILREIEYFLKSRELIIETATQHKEAKHFLELIQIEAGIIVERGKDENDQGLYGFVHRTFQEYFAAADVYERYQQQEDPAVIRDFLREHLHDPHWREVILLLLGKLKRKPVTVQLRQLLEGTLNCQLSIYTDILQQDLFFACSCLVEEIIVEKDVSDSILTRLSDLVKNSPFLSQSKEALDAILALTQTRQYSEPANHVLISLALQQDIQHISVAIDTIEYFYQSEKMELPQKIHMAIKMLLQLIKRPDLLAKHAVQIAELVHTWRTESSEYVFATVDQQLLQELLYSPRRFESSTEQSFKLCELLYDSGIPLSENDFLLSDQQLVRVFLQRLHQHRLTAEQKLSITEILYQHSLGEPERAYIGQELLRVLEHPIISLERVIQAARMLYRYSLPNSTERHRFITLILRRVQQSRYTVDSLMQVTDTFHGQEGRWLTLTIYLGLSKRPNLTLKQSSEIFQTLYRYCPSNFAYKHFLAGKLFMLIERSNFVLHKAHIALTLYSYSPQKSEERRRALLVLKKLAKLPELPFEQMAHLTICLYQANMYRAEQLQSIRQTLLHTMEQSDVSLEQGLQVIQTLYKISPLFSQTRVIASKILLGLVQRPSFSLDIALQTIIFLAKHHYPYSETERKTIEELWDFVLKHQLTPQQILLVASIVTSSLASQNVDYSDRMLSIHILLRVLGKEAARKHVEEHWKATSLHSEDTVEDIPSIADLASQEVLPANARNEMYEILRDLLPQFDKIAVESSTHKKGRLSPDE